MTSCKKMVLVESINLVKLMAPHNVLPVVVPPLLIVEVFWNPWLYASSWISPTYPVSVTGPVTPGIFRKMSLARTGNVAARLRPPASTAANKLYFSFMGSLNVALQVFGG